MLNALHRGLNNLRSSRIFLWLPAIWILVAVGLDVSLARTAVQIWPSEGRRILAFSDQPNGGRSTSVITPQRTELAMTLRLDSGITYPVAGGIFFLNRKGVDVSGQGDLELSISRSDLSTLQLCLVEEIPGFTRDDRWETGRYECTDLELVPGLPTYRVPLEKFTSPSWWYSTAGIRPSTLGPERRERVVRMVLQNGSGTPLGKDLELRIARISIVPSNFHFRVLVWTLSMGLFLVHGFFLLRSRTKKPDSVPPKTVGELFFQPIEAISYADRERDAVVLCIGRDFSDPELSLEKIARSTGVPVDRVTHHVKMASGLLFKAYLNKVRGEAARKLLAETDLPIAEISQRVGYSNTPHFNRVFKELFDTTPTALREGPL